MRYVLFVCILGLGLITAFRIASAASPQQDVIRLEARLNQLEQRLFGIETTLRNIEQQSRLAGVAQRRGVSPEDLIRLQAEIQTLQVRLTEDECGLAKLDERTLSPPAREARRKSATRPDPCRTNFDTPVRSSQ